MGVEVKLVFYTDKVVKSIQDSAAKRVAEAVNEVRNVTLETLSGNRTGRTYKVPGTQKEYTASAPGEPPAQATGRLRQDVKVSVEGTGKKIEGTVGTTLKYGKRLEFGFMETDSLGRRYNMAPRPWLKPSFEKALDRVMEILGGRWI